jgi:hypothetical protein
MSSPQTLNREYAVTNTKPLGASGDAFSRRMCSEIIRLSIFALIVFLAAIILPTGNWLELAFDEQAYHVDDIVVAVFVVSFVLMIFLLRGWREVRQEASKRAVAVRQMEQHNVINAQLSQMSSLLHACFTVEEASKIISHFAQKLFPDYRGPCMSSVVPGISWR